MADVERTEAGQPAAIEGDRSAAIEADRPAAIEADRSAAKEGDRPAAIDAPLFEEPGGRPPPRGPIGPWTAWIVAAAAHALVLSVGSVASGAEELDDDQARIEAISRYLAAADEREMEEYGEIAPAPSYKLVPSILQDGYSGMGFGGDDPREEGTELHIKRSGDASVAGSGRGSNGQGPGTSPKPPARVPAGKLAPELIQKVVRQNFGRFQRCLEGSPNVSWMPGGRVTIHFVIGVSGEVASSMVLRSDLWDRKVAECVAGAFGSLVFPKPAGGVVRVTYPIMFTPGG